MPGGGTMHRLWAAESMIKLVAPESPPEQPVIRDVTEMSAGVSIAIVEDPDGNHVEFLERR